MKHPRHNAGRDVTAMAQKILGVFRQQDGRFVSGEELSSLLHVSRTAVWKQVNALRSLGYQIESLPSRGYRLSTSPDILLPAEIQNGLHIRTIGTTILCFPETESTNQLAFKLAEEGATDGTVVIADAQSRGKGRLGREWVSPPGVNIYCSVILRPPILPVSAYQLTFLSAVAVARAVELTTPLVPDIKWPNDILVGGSKIAGLLNEMSAETEKVNFIVLGIGVNLNMRREQFPAGLRHPATSLLIEGGGEINRITFLRILLRELDLLYQQYLREGDVSVRQEWLTRCRMLGRTVRVTCRESVFSGVVTGVDGSGALLVRLQDGRDEQVLSGDVDLL